MTAPAPAGFSLGWLGASDGCAGLPLSNQPIVAGTKLAIGLRQPRPVVGERPERVFILSREEPLLQRILPWRHPREIEQLPFGGSTHPDFVAMTDPWPLTPPGSSNGHLRFFCSLSPQRQWRGPTVTSVAMATQAVCEHVQKPNVIVKPTFSFGQADAGVRVKVEPNASVTKEFQARVALDPDLEIRLLLPGDGEGTLNAYLSEYLAEVADRQGIDRDDLTARFFSEYGPSLPADGGGDMEVWVEPERVVLAAGESASVLVHAFTSQPSSTMAAIQITDLGGGARTVSELIQFSSVDEPPLLAYRGPLPHTIDQPAAQPEAVTA